MERKKNTGKGPGFTLRNPATASKREAENLGIVHRRGTVISSSNSILLPQKYLKYGSADRVISYFLRGRFLEGKGDEIDETERAKQRLNDGQKVVLLLPRPHSARIDTRHVLLHQLRAAFHWLPQERNELCTLGGESDVREKNCKAPTASQVYERLSSSPRVFQVLGHSLTPSITPFGGDNNVLINREYWKCRRKPSGAHPMPCRPSYRREKGRDPREIRLWTKRDLKPKIGVAHHIMEANCQRRRPPTPPSYNPHVITSPFLQSCNCRLTAIF
ncbi:hypothetical protein AAG570_004323 [Ranatra chinensis]|uniref:Uncharacterized protein n=1 Tax=Ranatra chinensis TaxID=642074 RepID=A0ABD0Y2X1_9HEMI